QGHRRNVAVRALLSVFDKTGLEALAKGLRGLGWELVSSGGTSRALAEAGLEHLEVEDVTGAAEMLDGRVKTLHPNIHGGVLADTTRRALARKAFAHTAAYDAAIVTWFDQVDGTLLPPSLHFALERTEEQLRYGENPHQQGARYREVGTRSWWDDVQQYSGLAL